jgi:hypothetical protein
MGQSTSTVLAEGGTGGVLELRIGPRCFTAMQTKPRKYVRRKVRDKLAGGYVTLPPGRKVENR